VLDSLFIAGHSPSMSELNFLSAVAMAEQIRAGKLSPVDLAEAHLSQIKRLNPKLNAFVQIEEEAVRRQALRAEKAVGVGSQLGVLHGVPVSIKSSIAVAGMRQEAGCGLRAGVVAEEDAPLVSRLRNAGAIVLGTTNTPELLMAWETDNLIYGRTNNPWDLTRTPGGSSGGEAAAIASLCSAGGVGSDGGGSIRVPAHFTGICGLKPTPGRIPATGHFPESLGPFALIGVVGPMARTMADLKLLFEVMQGPDDDDTSSAPAPIRWTKGEELRKLRVGYFENDGRTPVTDETRQAVRTAARALSEAGFEVERFRPEGLEKARQLWWKFFGVAGGMMLRPMIKGGENEISPILKQFLEWTNLQPAHSGESLLEIWIERDQLRAQIFAQMRQYPILLCPVASIPAFRHGERAWKIDGEVVEYLDAWSYTEWFNLLGMPAAVVPLSRSTEGLPIGVQIAAKPWQEELVLSVAEAIEANVGESGYGGWKKPPIF
jgi:Asp-tRNA(Asn)/Glu-tRNA(Gln) amidotransferase A subunit family amidase